VEKKDLPKRRGAGGKEGAAVPETKEKAIRWTSHWSAGKRGAPRAASRGKKEYLHSTLTFFLHRKPSTFVLVGGKNASKLGNRNIDNQITHLLGARPTLKACVGKWTTP